MQDFFPHAIEMRRKRNIGAEYDCIANFMVTFLKFLLTYSMKFDEIYSIKSISSQISVKKKNSDSFGLFI